jgi:hypothetical protein
MRKICLGLSMLLGACNHSESPVDQAGLSVSEENPELRIVMLENSTKRTVTKVLIMSAKSNSRNRQFQIFRDQDLVLRSGANQPFFFTTKVCVFVLKITYNDDMSMETKPQDFCEKNSLTLHERDRELSIRKAEKMYVTARA